MSLSIVLVPLAVAVITSAMNGYSSAVAACARGQNGRSEKIPTKYRSEELLKKTLMEHGAVVRKDGAGAVTADFGSGKIRYDRPDESVPYDMQVFDVANLDDIVCSIREINSEYGENVQSYAYHRVKDNLPEGMTLASEEVLEDNSILLTINLN